MNLKIADVGKLLLLLCACGRVAAQYGYPATNGYPATSSYGSVPASNPYSPPVSSGKLILVFKFSRYKTAFDFL